MKVSYQYNYHVCGNSEPIFDDRTELIKVVHGCWVVCSSKPLFELTEDLNMFNDIDHREQFREHYGINEGFSIEYISSAGNSYYINHPENPHGYDRMSFMIYDIVPDVKLTLYPIHDIIATYTHEEFLKLYDVSSRNTEN